MWTVRCLNRHRTCSNAGEGVPPCLDSPAYLARGYGADERIVYGTGEVVALADLPVLAKALLTDARVAFVHVRSASNNCWQARIDAA